MKKLFLLIVVVFLFVACDNNKDTLSSTSNPTIENSYIAEDKIESEGMRSKNFDDNIIPDKEGYEKFGYRVYYKIKGQELPAQQDVYFYKKDGKISYFEFERYRDTINKNINCSVEVIDNTMTSEECGNKEGEVVNKILNAIENKTYFDY